LITGTVPYAGPVELWETSGAFINNNNNNYDNLYGTVTRPYRYKGALQATTLGRP